MRLLHITILRERANDVLQQAAIDDLLALLTAELVQLLFDELRLAMLGRLLYTLAARFLAGSNGRC